MAIRTIKPLVIPREAHNRPVNPLLLKANGIKEGYDPLTLYLAHTIFTGTRLDNGWYVLAVDPADTPKRPEDAWGSFVEEDRSIEPDQLLELTEDWVRASDATEWVPGRIISAGAPSDTHAAIGHMLVRTHSWRD